MALKGENNRDLENGLSGGGGEEYELTLTTVGSSGAATYNSSTDTLNIPIYASPNIYSVSNGMSENPSGNFQLGATTAPGAPLLHNSYIDSSTFFLKLTGSAGATNILQVENTSNGGGAISGLVVNGTAIAGTSGNGVGVIGTSTGGNGIAGYSTSQTGVYGQTTSGYAIWGYSVTGIGGVFNINPTSTNTVAEVMRVYRDSSGTATNGIGASIDYYVKTNSGLVLNSNQLISKWTNSIEANRTSQFEINTTNNGAVARKFALAGNGTVVLDGYGDGVITGTATFGAAFDTTGKLIEIALGGGGGSFAGLPLQNTLYVSKNGNDGTALRTRIDLPYLTLEAAHTAALAGDTIVVHPGTYELATPLFLKDGVNYEFLGKGEVLLSTSYVAAGDSTRAIFTDNNTIVTSTINAPGWNFTARTTQSVLWQHTTSRVRMTADVLTAHNKYTIWSKGYTYVKATKAVANSFVATMYHGISGEFYGEIDIVEALLFGGAIYLNNSPRFFLKSQKLLQSDVLNNDYLVYVGNSAVTDEIHIDAELLSGQRQWPVWTKGDGDVFIKAHKITCNSDCVVVASGNPLSLLTVQADIIESTKLVLDGILHGEGAKLRVIGAKVVRAAGATGWDVMTRELGGDQGYVELVACTYDPTKVFEEDLSGSITRTDNNFIYSINVSGPTGAGYILTDVSGTGEFTSEAPSGGGGGGDMLAANNLSDVANASTSRVNLGLGNVDNTTDLNKPISTLTQAAINLKENALGNPGVNGYVLSSTTAGTRSWVAQSGGGGVTPAALTKTDDTNITLTLGGTPSTALLQATSITVGWSGSLAATRGGTGQTTVATGQILYGSAANVWSKLNAGTNGHVLTLSGGIPAWVAPSGGGGSQSLQQVITVGATMSANNTINLANYDFIIQLDGSNNSGIVFDNTLNVISHRVNDGAGNVTNSSFAADSFDFTLNATGSIYNRIRSHNGGIEMEASNASDSAYFEIGPTVVYAEADNIELVTAILKLIDLPTYADEAAAVIGGLATDTVYKTASGALRIKL